MPLAAFAAQHYGGSAIARGKKIPHRYPMITSKLTSKARTTIPQPVRTALDIRPGDDLAYQIENGRVILSKAPRRPVASRDPAQDPFATFWEWSSQEDAEDFADL